MSQLQGSIGPRQALWKQIWEENPIFRQVLGICSALAVTNLVFNTSLMCAGLIWTTVMSSLTASLFIFLGAWFGNYMRFICPHRTETRLVCANCEGETP